MSRVHGSVLIALLVAIGQISTPVPAAAGVAQSGARSIFRCYGGQLTNDLPPEKAPPKGHLITDLHIRFARGAHPVHIKAPPDWGSTVGPDGSVTFQTPSPDPRPTTRGRDPIPPGESRGGFRICLTGKEDAVASISYGDGHLSHAVKIISDGKEVDEGGVVLKTSELRCFDLQIAATDAAVWDVHLSQATGSDFKPEIDSVTLPSGWNGGPSESGDQANLVAGGHSALLPGQSMTVTVCFRDNNTRVDWVFTDKDHNDIPNTKGTVVLK